MCQALSFCLSFLSVSVTAPHVIFTDLFTTRNTESELYDQTLHVIAHILHLMQHRDRVSSYFHELVSQPIARAGTHTNCRYEVVSRDCTRSLSRGLHSRQSPAGMLSALCEVLVEAPYSSYTAKRAVRPERHASGTCGACGQQRTHASRFCLRTSSCLRHSLMLKVLLDS